MITSIHLAICLLDIEFLFNHEGSFLLLSVISFSLISGCGVPGAGAWKCHSCRHIGPHCGFWRVPGFPQHFCLVSLPAWHTWRDWGSDSEKGEIHSKFSPSACSSAFWLSHGVRCRPDPTSNLGAPCGEAASVVWAHLGLGWEALPGHTQRIVWSSLGCVVVTSRYVT